mgnify:CR=1 FL=1
MTSILKVDSIQNAAGTSAMTFDSGGNISEANKEYFHVRLSTRITGLSDNTVNVVNFNSNGLVQYDTKSNWDSTNNAYQFDSADGVYLITYSVGLQSPTVSTETMVDGAASMMFSTDDFSSVVNAPQFGNGMRVQNNVGDEGGSVPVSGSVLYKNTNANMKVQMRVYANTSGSATYSISEQANQMLGSTVSDFTNSDCTYFSVVRIA